MVKAPWRLGTCGKQETLARLVVALGFTPRANINALSPHVCHHALRLAPARARDADAHATSSLWRWGLLRRTHAHVKVMRAQYSMCQLPSHDKGVFAFTLLPCQLSGGPAC